MPNMVRVPFEELAKAEFIGVIGFHQFMNPLGATAVIVDPLAKLRCREIVIFQALDDGISSELTGFQSKVNTGTVNGIDKPKGIANEHPAVTRLPGSLVGKLTGNAVFLNLFRRR